MSRFAGTFGATLGALLSLTVLTTGCNEQPSQAATPTAPVRGTRIDSAVESPAPPKPDAAAGGVTQGDVAPTAAATGGPKTATVEPTAPTNAAASPTIAASPNASPTAMPTATPQPAAGGPVLKPGAKTGPLGAPDPIRQGYTRVSFNELACFEYDPFDAGVPMHSESGEISTTATVNKPTEKDRIPANILALNGKKLAVQGFMMPIEIKRNQVKSFLLVRNQMACCFGMMLGFNEWVFIRCPEDKPADFVPDVVITVYGTMEVGEEIQDGAVMSIFRMRSDEVLHSGGS